MAIKDAEMSDCTIVLSAPFSAQLEHGNTFILSSLILTSLTMNHSGPPDSHLIHPWLQSQRTPQSGEQYTPYTIPSYISDIALPSTSYTQDRVVNYNHESNFYGQQAFPGMVNGSCQLTIPFELLNQQITMPPQRVGLKEIIFLGPLPGSIELFLSSRDAFIMRAIHLLEQVQSLKKITFSLDFADTRILGTLAAIHGMQEIELTLPTASELKPHSMNMVGIHFAFITGLTVFRHLKRLTIPMEFVTALLLSYLANLPNLESLTVRYSPPPRPPHHQQQFPAWSSYTVPAECPGYVFLAHLKFDPRKHFKQLLRLDLGAPLSDASYTTLRSLFPKAHIC